MRAYSTIGSAVRVWTPSWRPAESHNHTQPSVNPAARRSPPGEKQSQKGWPPGPWIRWMRVGWSKSVIDQTDTERSALATAITGSAGWKATDVAKLRPDDVTETGTSGVSGSSGTSNTWTVPASEATARCLPSGVDARFSAGGGTCSSGWAANATSSPAPVTRHTLTTPALSLAERRCPSAEKHTFST